MLNLVSDALKFTADGGVRMHVGVAPDRERGFALEISVQDTGIGITADRQERIFLPFTQVDASTARNYGGTGLGMSICRLIAHHLDGRLELHSEAGKGSTFIFTVPVALTGDTVCRARPTTTGGATPSGRAVRQRRSWVGETMWAAAMAVVAAEAGPERTHCRVYLVGYGTSEEEEMMTSMSAADWDSRYCGTDLVWSATPNVWVEQETTGLTPGRALDLACGEGRNSIWLAALGWQVTGVDFSAAALAKAATLAGGHSPAVTVDWHRADVTTFRSSTPCDLAMLVYVQLPAPARLKAIMSAWSSLAPDGILLVVAHHTDNLSDGVGGPQDPAVLYTERDVVADLGAIDCSATVERAERVSRTVDGSARPALDTVVRARRLGPDA